MSEEKNSNKHICPSCGEESEQAPEKCQCGNVFCEYCGVRTGDSSFVGKDVCIFCAESGYWEE